MRRDAKAPNLDMAFLMLLELILSHGLGVHLEHTIAILQIQNGAPADDCRLACGWRATTWCTLLADWAMHGARSDHL
jgi:hypothetical protein